MLGSDTTRSQPILRAAAATAVAAGLLLSACGGDDDATEAADDTGQTTETTAAANGGAGFSTGDGSSTGRQLPSGSSWRASANSSEVAVYPDETATEPIHTLTNPNEHGAELVFLVDGSDNSGDRIPVHLPVPPNGSIGWVDAADVTVAENPYRITIQLAAHQLIVNRGDEQIVTAEVGVGRNGRETPTGLYYLTDLFQPSNPAGDYGPYVYGISGYPTEEEILAEFGEDTFIGIHGTNQPELLGQDVSSGCIRMHNDKITELTQYLPLGTPVDIQA